VRETLRVGRPRLRGRPHRDWPDVLVPRSPEGVRADVEPGLSPAALDFPGRDRRRHRTRDGAGDRAWPLHTLRGLPGERHDGRGVLAVPRLRQREGRGGREVHPGPERRKRRSALLFPLSLYGLQGSGPVERGLQVGAHDHKRKNVKFRFVFAFAFISMSPLRQGDPSTDY
jgi:hypothetical protein